MIIPLIASAPKLYVRLFFPRNPLSSPCSLVETRLIAPYLSEEISPSGVCFDPVSQGYSE